MVLSRVVGLAVLCALAPLAAQAATWTLTFSGPQSAQFVINDLQGAPYVSSYSVTGLDLNQLLTVFPGNWNTTLPDTPDNMFQLGLVSDLELTSTGGTITIGPSFGLEAFLDSNLDVQLNYTLMKPEPVGSNFDNVPVIGSYTFDYFIEEGIGGEQVLSGEGGGSITSLSALINATVPEPVDWALMVTGMAVVGAAMRMSRRGRQGLPSVA